MNLETTQSKIEIIVKDFNWKDHSILTPVEIYRGIAIHHMHCRELNSVRNTKAMKWQLTHVASGKAITPGERYYFKSLENAYAAVEELCSVGIDWTKAEKDLFAGLPEDFVYRFSSQVYRILSKHNGHHLS